MKNIVVYVSRGARGEYAVRRAATLAVANGARVRLVVDDPESARVERLAAILAEREVDVHLSVLSGRRLPALLREIERGDVDLVIKAADGADMAQSLFRRGFTERLIASCPVPVWLVRLAPAERPRRVILHLGSTHGASAVEEARLVKTANRLATQMSARLFTLLDETLISDSGRAARLPADAGDPLEATLVAIQSVRADLVITSQSEWSALPGTDGRVLMGLLRSSHVSVLCVPRAKSARRRSSAAPRWAAAGIVAAVSIGCAAPPPASVPSSSGVTGPTNTSYAYAKRTRCDRPEARQVTIDVTEGSQMYLGHHDGGTCRGLGADVDARLVREQSLSPSEGVRVPLPVYEIAW